MKDFILFESAKLLIARAQHHASAFELELDRYHQEKPYKLIEERQPATNEIVWKVALTQEPPKILSVIMFDAFNCARSALDHAVFDAAKSLGGTPKPKYTKFPFGLLKKEVERDLNRKNAAIPQEMQRYLIGFKAYRRGNRTLWGFNEIRNGKIHKILMATIPARQAVSINPGSVAPFSFARSVKISIINRWDHRKRELLVGIFSAEVAFNMKFDFSVAVAFGKGTPFSGQPATEKLKEFISMVNDIVLGIEKETWRLKQVEDVERIHPTSVK